MRGFEMVSTEVEQYGLLHISGDVVPPEFFQAIKFDSGKPDLLSVLILSNLLYWYRPIKPRDERTDRANAWRQKFQGEMLSRTYQEWADIYGATERQARDACHRLQARGLLTISCKPCSTGGTTTYFAPVYHAVQSLLQSPSRLTPERESEQKPTHVETLADNDSRQNVSRDTFQRESLNKERARDKTTKETNGEITPPPKSVLTVLLKAYKQIARDIRDLEDVKNAAILLESDGHTVEQVEAWLATRRKLSGCKYIAKDFRAWVVNEVRANVVQMPVAKKYACSTCQDSGSISVFENGAFARYADCQCQTQRRAA